MKLNGTIFFRILPRVTKEKSIIEKFVLPFTVQAAEQIKDCLVSLRKSGSPAEKGIHIGVKIVGVCFQRLIAWTSEIVLVIIQTASTNTQ